VSGEVAAYHAELTARLADVLGEELVGVYAGGSFVLGGYDEGRSDLDVAAIVRSPVARETKQRLADAVRHESLPCPARGLEFVLYPAAVASTPSGEAGFELDLNSGERMPFHLAFDDAGAARHWYVIDRSIFNAHGAALRGPPASAAFAPIPRALLVPAVLESLRWHETGDTRPDDAVLNACRAARHAVDGTWSNKREAGRWALDRLDDPTLVTAALEARFSGAELAPARVRRFLCAVAEQVRGGR
jgi:hypothetical protein